jgi:hypothetical protein
MGEGGVVGDIQTQEKINVTHFLPTIPAKHTAISLWGPGDNKE